MIHGKPVIGYFAIEVAVACGRAFQLRSKGFDATVCDVVLNGRVDEAAALAGLGHPVYSLNGCLRQDDVNTLAHEIEG